jgi:hypothetical protein
MDRVNVRRINRLNSPILLIGSCGRLLGGFIGSIRNVDAELLHFHFRAPGPDFPL